MQSKCQIQLITVYKDITAQEIPLLNFEILMDIILG